MDDSLCWSKPYIYSVEQKSVNKNVSVLNQKLAGKIIVLDRICLKQKFITVYVLDENLCAWCDILYKSYQRYIIFRLGQTFVCYQKFLKYRYGHHFALVSFYIFALRVVFSPIEVFFRNKACVNETSRTLSWRIRLRKNENSKEKLSQYNRSRSSIWSSYCVSFNRQLRSKPSRWNDTKCKNDSSKPKTQWNFKSDTSKKSPHFLRVVILFVGCLWYTI